MFIVTLNVQLRLNNDLQQKHTNVLLSSEKEHNSYKVVL